MANAADAAPDELLAVSTWNVRLRLAVSTWNVSNTAPPSEGLSEWLRLSDRADFHAVALQEVVDLNHPLSYCCGSASLSKQAAAWEARVSAELAGYERVACRQLVGLVLLIYVSPALAPFTSVDAQAAGTGPLGFGNKGAIAATLLIKGTSLTIMCCHMAAGKKGPHKRNAEHHQLMRRLRLGVHGTPADDAEAMAAASGRQLLVWCGDMNYRLALGDEEAREIAEAGDYTTLLAADELRACRSAGEAFRGFAERFDEQGATVFPPTYKYDLDSDSFDSSKKRRAPAYCDRVLWRAEPNVCCDDYTSHARLSSSDHRPVSASLTIAMLPFEPSLSPVFRGTEDTSPCAALFDAICR